jgi:hypothetical protein
MAKSAILLASDIGYSPFAVFLLWQIQMAASCGEADLVLATDGNFEIPPSLQALGIRHLSLAPEDFPQVFDAAGSHRNFYLKPVAIRKIASDYDRILYLDADIFYDGGNIARLLNTDLNGKPVGAARDLPAYSDPDWMADEFERLGIGPNPYLNAGVLLIDTLAFREQKVFERIVEFAELKPDNLKFADQSALNGVLQGDFAEISPVWNWICHDDTTTGPISGQQVIFWHFAGSKRRKPWNDWRGRSDSRFGLAYGAFLREHFPDVRCHAVQLKLPLYVRILKPFKTKRKANPERQARIAQFVSRFASPFDVIFHRP